MNEQRATLSSSAAAAGIAKAHRMQDSAAVRTHSRQPSRAFDARAHAAPAVVFGGALAEVGAAQMIRIRQLRASVELTESAARRLGRSG